MVAGPRNQRYLHPRFLRAGVFVCQVDQRGKLAIELDPEFAIFWHEPDFFNEITDAFRSFQAGMIVIEGFGQIHDLMTVKLGKVRVKSRHGGGAASDPVTQERGWVLAQYLSSIDRPIPAQVATESSTEPLTVAPTSPKSNKRHRAAKHAVHGVVVANADPWNARWARRADRRRGFGLFMFRPLPRFAQR